MDTRELYQTMIIDHSRHPRNFYENQEASAIQQGHNPLCGDKLTLYLVEKDGVIKEASFKGEGCAIAIASASLMTDSLKGKTAREARDLFEVFHTLITEDAASSDSDAAEKLGKLYALAGVREYSMRVKCATLAWHTLLAALQKEAAVVNTETDNALLTLTDKAADYIKNLLKDKPGGSHSFRLSLTKSGCSDYMYQPELVEQGEDGDIYQLSSQGVPIYIDKRYADILKGTTLDLIEKSVGQKQMVFHNPQALDACGCGESFRVNTDQK